MKVHDGDLEFMVDVMKGHAEASDCDHSRELAEKVVAELLALRVVADAAVAYRDEDVDDDEEFTTWAPLLMALREAGR
jgi:hypothetical protein